jgi:uncharacterized glyoxalase superfamily protein PhnB
MESEGQPTIFPVLRYKDARASIDWLVRAFGFDKHAEHAGPEGTIAHAEVGLGAGLLAISSWTPPTDANPWSNVRQGLYVVVTDPDAHHARAKSAGAEIASPLTDMDYGSRDYAARDLDGNLWGFGTYNMGGRRGAVTFVPELRCHDAPAAVAFFTRAFGFESTFEVPGPNGSLVHGELHFGEGVLVGQLSQGGEWADLKQFVNVVVDDPDRHHARAKAAGADIVMGPKDTPFGARFYAARDPEGFLWWLSTYKPAKKQIDES